MHPLFWLSLIQGIAESFPISSSSHIILLSHYFGWKEGDLSTDVSLHFGTFFALCVIFRKDFFLLIKGLRTIFKKKYHKESHFFMLVTLATLPILMGGFIVHYNQWITRNPCIIALANVGFGLILYGVDRWASLNPYQPPASLLPYKVGLFIGCLQCLSLLPGISRLGICMTAGRLAGYSLTTATHFGFILGIPTIGAALVLKAPSIIHDTVSWPLFFTSSILTFSISFPFTLFFLYWIRRYPLWPFMFYRFFIGLTLLITSLCCNAI